MCRQNQVSQNESTVIEEKKKKTCLLSTCRNRQNKARSIGFVKIRDKFGTVMHSRYELFRKPYKNRLIHNQAMEITTGRAMQHWAILYDFASPLCPNCYGNEPQRMQNHAILLQCDRAPSWVLSTDTKGTTASSQTERKTWLYTQPNSTQLYLIGAAWHVQRSTIDGEFVTLQHPKMPPQLGKWTKWICEEASILFWFFLNWGGRHTMTDFFPTVSILVILAQASLRRQLFKVSNIRNGIHCRTNTHQTSFKFCSTYSTYLLLRGLWFSKFYHYIRCIITTFFLFTSDVNQIASLCFGHGLTYEKYTKYLLPCV